MFTYKDSFVLYSFQEALSSHGYVWSTLLKTYCSFKLFFKVYLHFVYIL